MSRALVRRLAVPLLIAGALLGVGLANANAPSIAALTTGGFLSSDIPALLGPISEGGRTGWSCEPEKAAGTRAEDAAELPHISSGPPNIAVSR